MDSWLQRIWYGRSLWKWVLLPFSLLFAVVVAVRRLAFRFGLLRSVRVDKPVIVVGNISVGGTGKTPLVIWLAQELSRRGFKPAVITRGYGGQSPTWPVVVTCDSDPAITGDESVLIAQSADAIVVSGPDRVADAQLAIARGADVVISDDGLQHYRLARNFELVVVDGARGFGNAWLLPAGPLREPVSRLKRVQAILATQRSESILRIELASWRPNIVTTNLNDARSLLTGELRAISSFSGCRIHALAGIGNPDAFFSALRSAGIDVDARALRDHAMIAASDLQFADNDPVFMTEKDAVKCHAFAHDRCWSVTQKIHVSNAEGLLAKIESAIRPKSIRS